MFSCSCCGKEFSRNFNRKRHEKQCQSNIEAMDEDNHQDHHGKSFDRDRKSTRHENDSNDESDTQSEDSSESDSEEKSDSGPWKRLVSQAFKDNKNKYNELVEHFQEEGHTEEHAHSKAHYALLKKYRKALRDHLVDEVLYFRHLRKTRIFKKIMETKKQFKDLDDFDDEEALRSAIKKREFLIDRLIEPMQVTDTDNSDEEEGTEEEEEEGTEEEHEQEGTEEEQEEEGTEEEQGAEDEDDQES